MRWKHEIDRSNRSILIFYLYTEGNNMADKISVDADVLRTIVHESLFYKHSSIWARIDALCYNLGYKGADDFLCNAPGNQWNPKKDRCFDFEYGE